MSSFFDSLFRRPRLWLGAAFGCVILENFPALDRAAQAPFFRNGEWLVTAAFHNAHKMLLYTGPKICLAVIASVCLGAFLAERFLPVAGKRLRRWRRPALIVFLSIVLVPLLIASLKAVTGVYGPVDLVPYGGMRPHMGFLEHLWRFGHTAGGRSFPAGNASGGFALISLYFLPLSPGRRRALLCAGFACGWLMGLYQMARGEHFLSHTLATMCLAFAVIGLLARLLPEEPRA